MNVILYSLIIAFVVHSIFKALYDNRRNLSFILLVWKRFNLKMLVECVGALIALIVFILTLLHYLPFTSFGWMNFIVQGGGNLFVAPVLAGSNSPHILIRLLVPLFFVLLIPTLPFLAKMEEDAFRRGNISLKSIAERSVVFGLIHMTMGVPLAAAIGLIGMGFFYAHIYRSNYKKIVRHAVTINGLDNIDVDALVANASNKAVIESTAYHTLCNTLLVALMLLMSLFAI